jgi:hypothetical protein
MRHAAWYLLTFLTWGGESDSIAADNTAIGPTIDGRIHEEEWAGSRVFSDFYVTVPRSGVRAQDSTIVYVKQSRDALYFAFRFWPRGRVISKSLIRDRSTDEENEFFIVLDLENNNENGYIFIFSFLDNQRDLLVYNQRSLSQEWDWIWQARSTIFREAANGEPGYIESEIRIPVDKLQNKNPGQIGLDLQLFAYRPDGSSYFYSIIPESELLSVKKTYKLDVEPFDERINLNVHAQPYVTANYFTDSTLKGSVGGELVATLDRHTLKGTFNTDESTLEADPFDFSLYGRPIFLQEKRPFFSKDLDLYRTPINLFYTRAIRDIQWGLNYTYRSDRFRGGAVYVVEEGPPSLTYGDRRRFLAARPRVLTRYANVGGMVLYARDPAEDRTDKIVSVDGRFDLPSRFVAQPQFIRGTDGNAYSAHLFYEYNHSGGPYGDLIYRRFDRKFSALTLFNNYGSDNDEIVASLGYRFVHSRKYFSDISVFTEYYRARTLSDHFKYQEYVSTGTYYKANDWLSVNHYFEFNRPNDVVQDTARITRRNFLQDHNAKIIFGPHSFRFGYFFGPYFGSYLKNPYATLEMTFFNRLGWNLTYIHVGYGDVDQNIYRIKMDYRLRRKLYLRSFFQRDTQRDVTFWNSLIQYEFFAGSNVFLVLNLLGNDLDYVGRYLKVAYEIYF